MKRHRHTQTRKRISRLFDGSLSGRATVRLWDDLARCPSCAALYARYHELESALLQSDDGPTRLSIERTAKAVMSSLRNEKVTASHLPWKRVAVAALSFIAVTAALWLMVPAPPHSHRVARFDINAWGARAIVPRVAASYGPSHVGIRIFVVPTMDNAVSEPSTLFIDDIMTFTYTQVKADGGYLMILGLQEHENAPLWYYPDYAGEKSIAVRGETVDAPLGDGFRLSINHRAGPLRIVSLFSDAPLETRVIESAVSRLQRQGKLLDVAEPLPLGAYGQTVTEYSVVLNIEDRNEE